MAQSAQYRIDGPVNVVSRAITESDTGTTVLAIDVPAGSWVPPFGVSIYIAEVFAGTTPALDVGDGSSTTGWVANAECVTGTATGMYTGTTNYASTGKYYSSADTIDCVVTADVTSGTAYISALMYDWSDLDVAAS